MSAPAEAPRPFCRHPKLPPAREDCPRQRSLQKASVLQMKNGLLTQMRQYSLYAAALIEQHFAFVGNHDVRRFAPGEMRFDLIREMMHIDDRRLDASLREVIKA